MVYNFGASAIQILGRSQFLSLYFLGGAFSQRESIAFPVTALAFHKGMGLLLRGTMVNRTKYR